MPAKLFTHKVDMKRFSTVFLRLFSCLLAGLFIRGTLSAQGNSSPFYDYRAESPGTVHKITTKDLPPPFATKSANNFPVPAPRPKGAIPKSLPGFKVDLFATGLDEPREMRTAPNGDVLDRKSTRLNSS